MIRSTFFAATAFLLLSGCGGPAPVANDMATNEAMYDNMTVDASADSLAAPSDMAVDSESNMIGSASGGNAM